MSEPDSPPEQPTSQHPAEPPQQSEQSEQPQQPQQQDQSEQTEHDVPAGPVETQAPARERVGLGLAAAVVALLLGAGLTLAVWSFGFVASITSFVMAAGATFFYGIAAGAPPRRGVVPLVGLVVVAVVGTFFLLVGYDAAQAYDEVTATMSSAEIGMGKSEFIRTSMVDGEVLGAYSKDMLFFFGFAVLGIWTTLKNVLGGARD